MKSIIDRLAWIERCHLSEDEYQKVVEDLTVKPEKGYGNVEAEEIELFETLGSKRYGRPDWIGVPRQYYLDNFSEGVYDDTFYQSVDTPWASLRPQFVGKLRPGQAAAKAEVLAKIGMPTTKYGGWIEAACGSGKTVTALSIAASLSTPTIILVHKSDLMKQWHKEISRFLPDAKVVTVQANSPDISDAHIVIATFQTLYSRRQSFIESGFFEQFGLVIADEAHRVPANTFAKVVSSFTSRYKLGLTATPDRKDGLRCILDWGVGPRLTTMVGDVVTGSYYISEWESAHAKQKFKTMDGSFNTSRIITTLCKEKARNEHIARVIVKAVSKGRKVLALTDRVSQLDELHEMCNTLLGDKILKYRKAKDLDRALEEDCRAVLATYAMFGEGTDVPALDTLVLCSPRSSIAQMIGRIQRPYKGKQTPFVLDVVDNIVYAKLLAKNRLKVYDKLNFNSVNK